MNWSRPHEAERADYERGQRIDFDLRQAEPPMSERAAVAHLIGYCESLVSGGQLGELIELGLRQHIAQTLAAFRMPSK